ncbi:MAG: hypothetical protein LBJ46_09265 [Planctomycetota bacterium]|nr:hypothetical protein [Planctomycetota bacterium]
MNDYLRKTMDAIGKIAMVIVSIGAAILGLGFFGVFALILVVILAGLFVSLWLQGRTYRKRARERDEKMREQFRDFTRPEARDAASSTPPTFDVTAEVEYVDDSEQEKDSAS